MRTVVTSILAFIVALTLGLGSAWYMIAEGSPLTTGHIGPWSIWYSAGNPTPDPYTRAYQARIGRLPITTTNALYFYASTDGTGRSLRSDCDYIIEGRPINAMWWSLALYDGTGRLIANKARRHAFSRNDVLRRPDGTFRIALAPTARPDNWLPSGDRESLQLVLRIYGPRHFNDAIQGRLLERRLPTITKGDCR